MSFLSDSRVIQAIHLDYDFAVHGGAVGDIDLGGVIPEDAVIVLKTIDVHTAFASGGAATIELKRGSDVIMAATAFDDASLVGLNTSFHITGPEISVEGGVTMSIAGAALTAGAAKIHLCWVNC